MRRQLLIAATAMAWLVLGNLALGQSDEKLLSSRHAMRVPRADKGAASLVFQYTGDEELTYKLVQEAIKLKKAMVGYDKVVLLKHQSTPSWMDFSEKDEKLADVIELPTKANLRRYLEELAEEGYYIDLWMVGHGRAGQFMVSSGTFGSKEWMKASEIRDLAKSCGYGTLPIRMVWSTFCYGESLNDAWIDVGAKVVAGSRYVNFYPNQFGRFADQWNQGDVGYAAALDSADTAASRTTVQVLIAEVLAPKTRKDWGGCPLLTTVLGDNDCARDYFVKEWLDRDEWQSGKSGKQNMNHSSAKLISGDGKITKDTKPQW